ncbi:MAG: phosphoribosylformylglycinamidine synthase subunit PurQ [Planctomycetaceae bacterium]|nr:MAG: phosphoribosylformylglycinamidine synthase subunit PurQ [Planctomycetaceae bacterium]
MPAPSAPIAPRALILRAPGTNCDHETAHAFEAAGAIAERVHINRLIENPALAARYQILCFPGGFSYGDDIAAGKILANRLQHHLADLVQEFALGGRDSLVLGICNGMQVMMRLGILTRGVTADGDETVDDSGPMGDDPHVPATLTWNQHGRYEARWVHLAVDPRTPCVFLKGIRRMYLPIAHAEGNFVAASADMLDTLAARGRLAVRYCGEDDSEPLISEEPLEFPLNPNGAMANVAGVCDPSGRVFGMMPHPERFIDPTQHPFWTRMEQPADEGEGMAIFRNAVGYFA